MKKLLSTTLTGSLMYSVCSLATAADEAPAAKKTEAPDNVQSVVVQGYRNSIKRAFDIKLSADTIVDSIVADDIGKLPDQNIAEAIARVPGVTISRGHGEGQFITVRGLGPEFNAALFNGRVLATENEGREYSFDILPAELISGVDVSKTASANQIEGGIGSTVNMKTAQPLDMGNKVVISGQGNYDRQRGKVSPQTSGVFSRKSDDGSFGALLAFSFIDRKIQGQRIFTDGWEANLSVKDAAGKTLTGVSAPTWIEYGINDTNRKRSSGLATLQWKPSKELVLTADALYSKLDVNDNNHVFFFWTGPDRITNATVDSHNTITSFNGVGDEGLTTEIRPRLAETKQFGFNAKWTPTARFSTVFDVSHSKATDSTGGNQAWFDSSLHAPGFDASKVKFHISPNGLPSYENLGNIADTTHATMGWLTWEGVSIVDKISQLNVNSKYKFGDGALKAIDFGLNYSDREKSRLSYKTPDAVQCLFCGIPLPSSVFTTSSNSTNFMGSGTFATAFPGYDVYTLQSYLLSDAAINKTENPAATRTALAANGGNLNVRFLPGNSGSAREKSWGAYVQANFGGTLGERDWTANVGVRYVGTDETSKGVGQEIVRIDTVPDKDPIVVLSNPIPLTESGRYREFLPSANFKLDVKDGFMLQTAVAKTMTRATLSQLRIARNINARERERAISDGNPGLKPMMAWNYDVSATWYDDKSNYFSVAGFAKRLTNLAENQTSTVQILGQNFLLSRPENIGSSRLRGVELSGQYLFSSLAAPFDGFGVQGNVTFVDQKDRDSSKTYNVVGFYEKGPWQVRVAYNYRDAYEATLRGKRGQPESVAAYGEVDANISYAVNSHLTVFAQAINLNNEKYKNYSIYPERVITYESYGPRYGIGARVSF